MNDNKNKLLKKTIQQFDKKHYELHQPERKMRQTN